MRLLHSITGVVVSVPVLLVVLAINGGYVYRTRCPHIQGSTETSWSYRIYEILPYIGYSRTGCQVHTATRVALDWVGLWKLPSAQPVAAGAPSTGHQGEYTGDQIASMNAHCVHAGKTSSFCACATAELTRAFTPSELARISSVTRFDQLPGNLATRAHDETTAIDQDCH